MSDPYLGEIRMFGGNFAPQGWALCNGQLLAISQFDALFALLGTTYGGDGQVTFALPNLQGRVPVHQGSGQGLTPRVLGEIAGEETVTIIQNNMPAHSHGVNATTAAGSLPGPGPTPLCPPPRPGVRRPPRSMSSLVRAPSYRPRWPPPASARRAEASRTTI